MIRIYDISNRRNGGNLLKFGKEMIVLDGVMFVKLFGITDLPDNFNCILLHDLAGLFSAFVIAEALWQSQLISFPQK